MSQGKQSFLGGAALLTVTMLITKAIGALYKIPLGNLLDEQGMNYFYAAYNIYNLLLMVSTAWDTSRDRARGSPAVDTISSRL